MIERRCGLSLTLKAAESLRIACYIFGKEFQPDKTVQPGVFGFIHHTHATAAKLFYNPVM